MSKADEKKSQEADAPYREALQERKWALRDIGRLLNSKHARQINSLISWLLLLKRVINVVELDSIPVADAMAIYSGLRTSKLKKLQEGDSELLQNFNVVQALVSMDIPSDDIKNILAPYSAFIRSIHLCMLWNKYSPEFLETEKYLIFCNYGAHVGASSREQLTWYHNKQLAVNGIANLESTITKVTKPVTVGRKSTTL